MSGSGVNRLIQSEAQENNESEETLAKRLTGNANEDAARISKKKKTIRSKKK